MKIKIYHSSGTIEVTLKDIYTKEQLIEALDTGMTIALTEEDDTDFILQPINVIAIRICNSDVTG